MVHLNTKKRFLAGIVITIATLIGATFYFRGRPEPSTQQVTQESLSNENQTIRQDIEEITEPISQQLTVPDQFKKGVFSVDHTLSIPGEYSISVFAAGMKSARFMDFDDNDNIFVTDISAGKVYMLKDIDRDNVAESIIEVDNGLKNPHGIDYYKGDLFVGEESQVVAYRRISDLGAYERKDVIIKGLPSGAGHATRTVSVGPDEKLYASIGSSCNVCEEKDSRRASLMRYNLDGSGGEQFASGLRNSVGFVFHNDQIWAVDNGRDRIGDDLPPEEVNIVEIGKNYGWPYCYGKGLPNPEFKGKEDFCSRTAFPKYELQAHSAPLGLSFNKNTMFVAFHGSWNRSIPTGFKVVTLDTSSDSNKARDFISGWLLANGTHWGRPVDVKFNSKGDLFITDDQNGAVYIVKRVSSTSFRTDAIQSGYE